MRKEIIAEGIDKIDDAFLMEAAAEFAEDGEVSAWRLRRKKPRVRFGRGMIAACLAVLILAGSGVGAYAAEINKLQAATAFFDEYGLSMEGLNNAEIKAVYQDISAQKFTYEKTASVIQNAVPACELPPEDVTPEELMAIWNTGSERKTLPQTGVGYQKGYQYKMDRKLGYHVLEKSVLTCYLDGELVWSAEFPEFYVEGSVSAVSGTVVWGRSYPFSDTQGVVTSWIALVDDYGRILWKKPTGHHFLQEKIASVLDNGDGTFAVISRGEDSALCLSQWDAAGTELCLSENGIEHFSIGLTARFFDGYLVQVGNINGYFHSTRAIIRLNHRGEILERLTFEYDQHNYYLTDMIEYEGMIYLSAYAVPIQEDEPTQNQTLMIWRQLRPGMTEEELLTMLGKNYTAVLLVFDPAYGIPKPFYSVDGALGEKLSTDENGQLTWNVQKPESARLALEADAYSIEAILKIHRYCFDSTGKPVGWQETGETVGFYR